MCIMTAGLTELASLLQGHFEHSLGPGREGDLHSHKAAAPANDLRGDAKV